MITNYKTFYNSKDKKFFNIDNIFYHRKTIYRFKIYRVGTAKRLYGALNLYKKDLDLI